MDIIYNKTISKFLETFVQPLFNIAIADGNIEFFQHKVLIITNVIRKKQLADFAGGRKDRSSDVKTKLIKL